MISPGQPFFWKKSRASDLNSKQRFFQGDHFPFSPDPTDSFTRVREAGGEDSAGDAASLFLHMALVLFRGYIPQIRGSLVKDGRCRSRLGGGRLCVRRGRILGAVERKNSTSVVTPNEPATRFAIDSRARADILPQRQTPRGLAQRSRRYQPDGQSH